jgi:Fuc2NAc and GlcNAc transferase
VELHLIWIAAGAAVLSAVITGVVRSWVIRRGLLDIPNQRSSHNVPTPRGGGIAVVAAMNVALIALALTGDVPLHTLIALAGGGAMVAIVGYMDDRNSLSARVRLSVHFAAAAWALFWLGGLPPLQFGQRVFDLSVMGYVLGALGIVWTLNLFNFMDGVDGIAASEAVFVAGAGAAIYLIHDASPELPALAVSLVGACAGFLIWNWPPAKIFMGDVGSGYIGYVIAVLAVVAARESTVALLTWAILGGVFFVDATVTLVRRWRRREKLYEAHRSHAYQWLARRWNSHLRVTIATQAVNLAWLLPCAIYSTMAPALAGWLVVAALAPVGVAAVLAGAGRRESVQSDKKGQADIERATAE